MRTVKESRYNVWVERDGTSYVYNGMSGALLSVTDDDRRALRSFLSGEDWAGCRPLLIAELVGARMVVPDDVDELDLLARPGLSHRQRTTGVADTG